MGKQTRTKNRSCRGKVAHSTRKSARAHLASLVAAGAYEPLLVIYPCKRCGKLHVGHRSHRKGTA